MTLHWEIYTLTDPRGGGVRYVGVTKVGVGKRLKGHISSARNGEKCHRAAWIRKLLSDGVFPVANVIESGSGDGWGSAESAWISHYRANGANLTNATDGGEGTWGHFVSLEAREASRKANLGKPCSIETRLKISEALKGKPKSPRPKPTPEEIARRVASYAAKRASGDWEDPRKGRPFKPDSLEKILSARKAVGWTEESRRKVSESLSGKSLSESHKAKISASSKGKVMSSEARAKMSASAKARHSARREIGDRS